MNPRGLTAIESRIWAATYGAMYSMGRTREDCSHFAWAAVKDFRALYPEID